jgi:hypothetical protein
MRDCTNNITSPRTLRWDTTDAASIVAKAMTGQGAASLPMKLTHYPGGFPLDNYFFAIQTGAQDVKFNVPPGLKHRLVSQKICTLQRFGPNTRKEQPLKLKYSRS